MICGLFLASFNARFFITRITSIGLGQWICSCHRWKLPQIFISNLKQNRNKILLFFACGSGYFFGSDVMLWWVTTRHAQDSNIEMQFLSPWWKVRFRGIVKNTWHKQPSLCFFQKYSGFHWWSKKGVGAHSSPPFDPSCNSRPWNVPFKYTFLSYDEFRGGGVLWVRLIAAA